MSEIQTKQAGLVVIKEGGDRLQMLYDAIIKASLFDIPQKIATCLKPWPIENTNV